MEATWIVVCDAGQARIFSAAQPRTGAWKLLETLDNPAGRARTSDLVGDHPGRVRQSGTGAEPAMAAPTDPAEREAQRFARQLARHLEHGYDTQGFRHLVLVAPPRFLGLLGGDLRKGLLPAIRARIHHDYTHLDEADVAERVRAQI
jgi:protein required for attachment to host cells